MSRAVMQLALDALQYDLSHDYIQEVVEKLRAELAKPEPEPVAAISPHNHVQVFEGFSKGLIQKYVDKGWTPLYRKEDV